MKEIALVIIGALLGAMFVLGSDSITIVKESGDQLQTNHGKQNYLLVPCAEADCK